jgi:hypothetical protein
MILGEMDFHQWVNVAEIAIWGLAGMACLAGSIGARGERRTLATMAGAAFLLFGVSDWIELGTGAWWRPWWLLAWKAVCIAMLVACFWHWKRIRRR